MLAPAACAAHGVPQKPWPSAQVHPEPMSRMQISPLGQVSSLKHGVPQEAGPLMSMQIGPRVLALMKQKQPRFPLQPAALDPPTTQKSTPPAGQVFAGGGIASQPSPAVLG